MHEIISNIAELLIIVWLGFDNINLIFKKSYYEQTLKNNEDKFSVKRFAHIKKVMATKFPILRKWE